MDGIFTNSQLLSMLLFFITAHITPGPFNFMIMSSVLSFGYKKSSSFLLGGLIASVSMMLLSALFVSSFLLKHPNVMEILKNLGIVYLVFLAYKIASSSPKIKNENRTSLSGLKEIFICTYLNPKGWLMYSASVTLFLTSQEKSMEQISIMVLLTFFCTLLTIILWGALALFIKKYVKNENILKYINICMSIILLSSIFLVI